MSEKEPTPRELEALKVLWSQRQGATVHEVCQGMSRASGIKLAYTTVLSLLQVMEQKGLVDHVREGKAYVYRAKVEREKTFRHLAVGFLENVFDGALDQYLVHVLDGRRLSARELDELEAMIAAARARQPARSTKQQGRRKIKKKT